MKRQSHAIKSNLRKLLNSCDILQNYIKYKTLGLSIEIIATADAQKQSNSFLNFSDLSSHADKHVSTITPSILWESIELT